METNSDINLNILPDLLGAINAVKLYSYDHPQTLTFVENAMERFKSIFQTEDKLIIGVFNESILLNQRPVVGMGKVSDSMIKLLNDAEIDQMVFLRGLEIEELTFFLDQKFGRGIEKFGLSEYSHILLGKISKDESDDDIKVDSIRDLDSSNDFIRMLQNLDIQKAFNFNMVNNLSVDLVETFKYSTSPLKYLAEVKSEDEYTYIHTINVALLSMSLAKHIGIVGSELLDIIYAALMHDVGKMLVPNEILNKTTPLTSSEFEIIKEHTLHGVMYLSNQRNIPRIAILAALEHHIKFNGGGYPKISPDWKPHFVSQIISISDIYDALRSNRPYRARLEHDEIIGILRHDAGVGLNPKLVEVFIDMLNSQSKELLSSTEKTTSNNNYLFTGN